jgi:DNA (cytosine-5)-methyltransferase 1
MKFVQNRRRDQNKIADLRRMGYSVLVVWECELDRREELKKKMLHFLEQDHRPANQTHDDKQDDCSKAKATYINGIWDEYQYHDRSVVRTVHLPSGRRVSTSIRAEVKDGDARSAFDYAYLRKSVRPKQASNSLVIRFADLYSGCGGLSLGAMEACRAIGKGFLPVAAFDKDPECIKVYERNFKCSRVYAEDITKILDGQIGSKPTPNERSLIGRAGNVDMLLAGPPCQGNSDLNNRTRRNDPRNALYERVARFVELFRPEHVLIENVPAAIHGKEKAVQRTIEKIRTLGYHVDSGTVDLSAIGVPQKRKRHVVVASRSKRLAVRDVARKHSFGPLRSVRWAIGDLENEPPNSMFTRPSRHTPENTARIQYLYGHSLFNLPDRLRPPCHRKGHSYKSMYGRLRMDEPAQTITSGFGSPGQGRYIHPTQMRTLTPHEAARLQFFPDFFDFSPAQSRAALASMIGNAAPMKLSYVICLDLLS